MATVWFAIVATMLAIYVMLDGFDFGAGILHRFVAKTDAERRTVLSAIGPVWDGNEVWLIAAGGVLFMAFPETYATAFSGFYMALMIVLWLLILRGIAIELRSHQENPLWHEFWDSVFSFASFLLALVFGAALGNLVRGVPLDEAGLAGMPLFTDFLPGKQPGILDWYTLLVGLFAVALLAAHGALFLAWRTTGNVHSRSLVFARKLWLLVVPVWLLVTLATAWIQPEIFRNLWSRPWSIALIILTVASLWGVIRFLSAGLELRAFLASCSYVFGLTATTLVGHYPHWLRSTIDPSFSLTAENTAADDYGLRIGLVWCSVGLMLAAAYFFYLFRSIREKVVVEQDQGY